MTDKELRKLSRRELLQLLLDQAKESERLRGELAAAGEQAREMDRTFQRLRDRLDDKDERIRELSEVYDRLRLRLNEKDVQIRKLSSVLQAQREGREVAWDMTDPFAEAAPWPGGISEIAPAVDTEEAAPAGRDEEFPALLKTADDEIVPMARDEEGPAEAAAEEAAAADQDGESPEAASETVAEEADPAGEGAPAQPADLPKKNLEKKTKRFLQKLSDFANNF